MVDGFRTLELLPRFLQRDTLFLVITLRFRPPAVCPIAPVFLLNQLEQSRAVRIIRCKTGYRCASVCVAFTIGHHAFEGFHIAGRKTIETFTLVNGQRLDESAIGFRAQDLLETVFCVPFRQSLDVRLNDLQQRVTTTRFVRLFDR